MSVDCSELIDMCGPYNHSFYLEPASTVCLIILWVSVDVCITENTAKGSAVLKR